MRQRYSEIISAVLLFIWASVPAKAQSAKDSTSRYCQNAMYVELGGTGGLYSVDYDHRITKEIGFRVGFTTWSIVTGFPVTANYLIGSHGHYLEIGIGADLGFTTFEDRSLLENALRLGGAVGTCTIGYRYQPNHGGFVFRIDFTPLFPPKDHVYPWGGISLGYAF